MPLKRVCDGRRDCADGRDEARCCKSSSAFLTNKLVKMQSQIQAQKCTKPCVALGSFPHLCVKHPASCRPGEVDCGKGQCRPAGSGPCQSQSSCGDSSEEGACGEWPPSAKTSLPMTSVDVIGLFSGVKCHHVCPNKVCLPKSSVCDGVVDCKDRSDELNCTRACEFQPLHMLSIIYSPIHAVDNGLIRLHLFTHKDITTITHLEDKLKMSYY